MSTICNELTKMTQSKRVEVGHNRLGKGRIAVEGNFRSPNLARLSVNKEAFVMESVRCQAINAMRYNIPR